MGEVLPFHMDERAHAAVLSDLPHSVAQEAGEFYENHGGAKRGALLKRDCMAHAWARVLRPYLIGLRDWTTVQARPMAGWRPIEQAPEDEHVILCTSGGHVGEALMLLDENTGKQKWTWALGPVHENHKPLGWMPMPAAIDAPSRSSSVEG